MKTVHIIKIEFHRDSMWNMLTCGRVYAAIIDANVIKGYEF